MNKQQIGLRLVLDSLGLPFKISCFTDRLILQKAIYLAQAAGVDLGYYYHWYLHGPYCSDLTSDAYDISTENEDKELKSWKLDENSEKSLSNLKKVLALSDRNSLASKLELLASVHFLIDRKQVEKKDISKITKTLKEFKRPFEEGEVEKALEELKTNGLKS